MPGTLATPQAPPPASSLSQPSSTSKKFSTVAGLSQFSNKTSGSAGSNGHRASVRNIFGDATSSAGASDETALRPSGMSAGLSTATPAGSNRAKDSTVRAEDGPWSVSVAEAKEERKFRRRQKFAPVQAYTLYVTTPTHNLTLQRTPADILELDQKVREGQSAVNTLPQLPLLASPPSTPQTGSRKILQTLSRTLSPGANRGRIALGQLTNSLGNVASSVNSSESKSTSPAPSSTPTPCPEVDEKLTPALATYFTTLSNIPAIRQSKAWRRFVRVRTDDLESVRVERRVHRVRSDLAQHVKSSVAPKNTNVGEGPSNSDLGEDGGRTDDEREGASISGRSGSRQSWNNGNGPLARPNSSQSSTDRPEVPARSTSVEVTQDASSKKAVAAAGSFADIPEEAEKEREAAAATGADTSVDDASNLLESSRRREQRRKRRKDAEKVTVDDFDMIRVLGKGCAGKVLLVRHKPTTGLFAMKSIHKRHVLAHQELQHTLTEQAVLKRMAREAMAPFIVKLWWSFHDKNNLYLVMDFHPGGDLATQLSRWGRLGRDRARFYAAEIVEGVEGLHKAGVIYRDLKPENVLIGVDGHIVLSDFGLSKEFAGRHDGRSSTPPPGSPGRSSSSRDLTSTAGRPHWMSASEDSSDVGRSRFAEEKDITSTFCGTAEYLAPEVIQGAAYSYEVDWWSFGTMLYEMLTGITPFWADTHAEMYVRVLHDELSFPDDRALDQDTKSILRGLLQRNPTLRMKEPRIKRHPYFSMIEWAHVYHKRYIPPYIPPVDPSNEMDTQNFDEAFLEMQPVVHGEEDEEELEATIAEKAREDKEKKAQKKSTAAMSVTTTDAQGGQKGKMVPADGKSLFDGYSFRGRKDSGSIRSSTRSDSMSISEAPVSLAAPADPAPATHSASSSSSARLTPQQATAPSSTTPAAVIAAQTRRSEPVPEEEESEDEESAARAAVYALAALEREASAEESMSQTSASFSYSTRPTSLGWSQDDKSFGHDRDSSAEAGPASKARGANGLPTTQEVLAETDDEDDDDWDLIDGFSGGTIPPSEVNGGKGQNLFARGVVDTYRLLRRQDSTRLTTPSVNSGTTRPFSRLSRQRRGLARPSKGDLTSGSAASLDSSSNHPGSVTAPISVHTIGGASAAESNRNNVTLMAAQDKNASTAGLSESGDLGANAPSTNMTTSQSSNLAVPRASPSTASSDEVNHDGKRPAGHDGKVSMLLTTSPSGSSMDKRQSRIKRRFTTFFEQAAR